MKFQPKEWKLDPQCDPTILVEIAKVADDPYPHGSTLLRKALMAVIYRFQGPERQQLRQRLQLMAAIERTDLLKIEQKADLLSVSLKALAFEPPHCRSVRGHAPEIMQTQLAVLQRYATITNPFPANVLESQSWIQKHAPDMWRAAELMLPCYCEYLGWNDGFIEILSKCSSINSVVESIVALKHDCSVVAMKKLISRSESHTKRRRKASSGH